MKQNTVNGYINRARQNASGRHLNFVGDRSNFAGQPSMYANANGGNGGGAKPSQPYVITISSASGSAVQNFDVLGAAQYLFNSGFTAGGDLVVGSVTISSGMPDVTYRDLLFQTQTQPFTVGMTYLACASPVLQVQQIYTITTKDSNGTLVKVPIVPAIDPYQQQQGILVDTSKYRIDQFTKLTFANILANAVLTVRFYPEDNINPSRELSGKQTTQQYSNPGIIR